MDTKVIVWTRPDGGISVFHRTDKASLPIEALADKVVPQGTPYQIIEKSELPDRSRRDAWEISGNKVSVNANKKTRNDVRLEKRNAVLTKLNLSIAELKDLLG